MDLRNKIIKLLKLFNEREIEMSITAKPQFTFHQWLREQCKKGVIECDIVIKEINKKSIEIIAQTNKSTQEFHIYKDTIYSKPENVSQKDL